MKAAVETSHSQTNWGMAYLSIRRLQSRHRARYPAPPGHCMPLARHPRVPEYPTAQAPPLLLPGHPPPPPSPIARNKICLAPYFHLYPVTPHCRLPRPRCLHFHSRFHRLLRGAQQCRRCGRLRRQAAHRAGEPHGGAAGGGHGQGKVGAGYLGGPGNGAGVRR